MSELEPDGGFDNFRQLVQIGKVQAQDAVHQPHVLREAVLDRFR